MEKYAKTLTKRECKTELEMRLSRIQYEIEQTTSKLGHLTQERFIILSAIEGLENEI
jgi:hypothetical protein